MLTRIKQLCCLGLDSQAIMPVLLKEMHDLVLSHANQFLWVDDRQQMSAFFFVNLEDMTPAGTLYLSEFYNRRENEVIWGFTEALRSLRGVLSFDAGMKVERRAYYRHDYYNLIMRPLGFDESLKAIIDEGGPALGAMILQRAPGDADYTAQDSFRLGAIIPYFAHALTAPPPEFEAPLVDSGNEGMMIVDAAGRVQFMSPEARRLLYLTSHPAISTDALIAQTQAKEALPAGAMQLCQRLLEIFHGGK
ncbi:MAG: hypothetical protein H0W93_01610 [Gammaproteobacteria bacterium]|nr:hypothetical protein [Gammaproteobacteria bacterium]